MMPSLSWIPLSCRLFITLCAGLTLALTAPISPVLAQVSSPAEQLAAASALFDAGKFADAAKLLDGFLAANPKHPRAGAAALALGRCRSELKQYAKAVPAYVKAIAAKDPSVTTLAELGLGEAALQTAQWATAAAALTAATQADLTPQQASVACTWLGQAQYQRGKYAEAETAYTQVIEKYPDSEEAADATFGAGLAALKLGKTDVARQRLQSVADRQNSEDRPQALLMLGQIAFGNGQYAAARDKFDAAFSAGSADTDTRQAAEDGLVNSLLKLGDNAGAASRLQAILAKLPPGDSRRFPAEATLGRCLYLQKEYALAEAAYGEAAKSPDPNTAALGLYWSANAALSLGHSAVAGARFASVAARYPHSEFAAKARARAGTVQAVVRDDRAAGTLSQARQDLTAKKYAVAAGSLLALLKNVLPSAISAEAQYLLGLADQGLGRSKPALVALTAAVSGGAGADWLPDAHVQLAWLSVALKQPAHAEKEAQAALALTSNPGDSPAVLQQARLALLQADLEQQKWDDAQAGCRVLLDGSPPPDVVATVLFTQAWVSEKQGKPGAALPQWQRLASEFPQSSYAPEALLHLGDFGFGANHYDEAQAHYAALLAKYPQAAEAPSARLGLGNALYHLGRYSDAAAAFDTLAADKSAGSLRPEALYWAGASWEKDGKKAAAIQRLTRLVSEYPASTHTANARVRLAYLKAGS